MNGKGDTPRPVDAKKFRENFDAIDWHRPVICDGCGWEIDPTVCHCGQEILKHAYHDNHSPVPVGCRCGYADPAARKNPNFTRCVQNLP